MFPVQLSIVIVNYNVKYFLEQCLHTVQNATRGIDAEVIVVDNHSADDSISYLQPLFPGVQFISNEANLGFATANNRALRFCQGEYVLFLNPDTLIPEDCLDLCLAFMKAHPHAGALGVRMLDGKGRFLPESKRAFPSPLTSFYKLSGLAALFPWSGIFNKYALGNLDEHQNHQVDVLAGAYMLVDKKVLEQLNGFDERYFLYGEDVDLSFRIQQLGRQNHYFAGTTILHFKGESSSRGSLNHVRFFYSAMLLFVNQYYKTGAAKWLSWFLRFAITFRAMIAVLDKVLRPVVLPLTDGVLVWLSLHAFRLLWISQVRDGRDFGVPFITFALPLFSLVFIAAAAFTGLYDKPLRTSKTLLAAASGAVAMLAVYALLPESIRFSRGVILWGGMSGGVLICLLRQWLFARKHSWLVYDAEQTGQTVVVGDENEYAAIMNLLEQAMREEKLLGRIATGAPESNALGGLQELAELEKKLPVREIIFCVGTLSLSAIITKMQQLSDRDLQFLFHLSGSQSIVGSHTSATTGKIVAPVIDYRIAQPYQKRMKRTIDLLLSFSLLITAPVHLVVHRNGAALMLAAWQVLASQKTWVGYASGSPGLPVIKKGVISHVGANPSFSESVLEKADRLYAKNYDWWQDIPAVFRHYRRLV